MSQDVSELAQFHQFVAQRLAHGSTGLTPEECLDEWRAHHPMAEDTAESVAAIGRGLAQMRAGEGVALDEFDRQFRQEQGLPLRKS